jgi:hypothetical protein
MYVSPGIVSTSLGFLLLGCTSLANVTSGQIGCAESDIAISDEDSGLNSETWTATCHGKTYFCSWHKGGINSNQVVCKEADNEVIPPAPRPKAPSGCQYDTQCKGDRVCSGGTCVDR